MQAHHRITSSIAFVFAGALLVGCGGDGGGSPSDADVTQDADTAPALDITPEVDSRPDLPRDLPGDTPPAEDLAEPSIVGQTATGEVTAGELAQAMGIDSYDYEITYGDGVQVTLLDEDGNLLGTVSIGGEAGAVARADYLGEDGAVASFRMEAGIQEEIGALVRGEVESGGGLYGFNIQCFVGPEGGASFESGTFSLDTPHSGSETPASGGLRHSPEGDSAFLDLAQNGEAVTGAGEAEAWVAEVGLGDAMNSEAAGALMAVLGDAELRGAVEGELEDAGLRGAGPPGGKMATSEDGLCHDWFGLQAVADVVHDECTAVAEDVADSGLLALHLGCLDAYVLWLSAAESVDCAVAQVLEPTSCDATPCAAEESAVPQGHGCACVCDAELCDEACRAREDANLFGCGGNGCEEGLCACEVCAVDDVDRCPAVAGQTPCRVIGCGETPGSCTCLYSGAEDGVIATGCVGAAVAEECDPSAEEVGCDAELACVDFACLAGSEANVGIPAIFVAGQTIRLVVIDEDSGADPDGLPMTDSVVVEVTGEAGDVLSVTLDEGEVAGNFFGDLDTADATNDGIDDANDTLEVIVGEVVTLSYSDPLWSDGDTAGVAVTATAVVFDGVDGTVAFDVADFNAGATLEITVSDGDFVANVSPGTLGDMIVVTVTGDTLSDIDAVTLSEVGDGLFSGTITTVFAGAAAPGDGTLQVTGGETVTVTYVDLLTDDGSTQNVTDSAVVNTGEDAEVAVTEPFMVPGDELTISVVDGDELADTNPASETDTVSVIVSGDINGDSETLELSESDPGSFSGPLATAPAASPTSDDGTLEVEAGEVIAVSYVDGIRADGAVDELVIGTAGVVGLTTERDSDVEDTIPAAITSLESYQSEVEPSLIIGVHSFSADNEAITFELVLGSDEPIADVRVRVDALQRRVRLQPGGHVRRRRQLGGLRPPPRPGRLRESGLRELLHHCRLTGRHVEHTLRGRPDLWGLGSLHLRGRVVRLQLQRRDRLGHHGRRCGAARGRRCGAALADHVPSGDGAADSIAICILTRRSAEGAPPRPAPTRTPPASTVSPP